MQSPGPSDPKGGGATVPDADDVTGGSQQLLDGGSVGGGDDVKEKMAQAAQQGDERLSEGEQGADTHSDAMRLGNEDTAPQTTSAGRGAGAGSQGGAISQG